MPANKYALLRYRIIDRMLRNKQRAYPSKEDLRHACEEALYGSDGEHISISTIEKDIWAMRNEGELGYYAPIVFNKERAGYAYSDPAYSISELPLNEDDLNAIKTAAETLFQFRDIPLFRQFDTAIEKILDRMRISAADSNRTEHEVLQFERGTEYRGSEFLANIFSAAKNRQAITFIYKKYHNAKIRHVDFSPYLIKEYRSRWYVIGFDHTHKGIRTYALDRMEGVAHSNAEFQIVEDFSTHSFFAHSMGITVTNDAPQKVLLEFSNHLAPYIASQPMHPTQQVVNSNDDKMRIEITVLITIELISAILGFGEHVRVLSPVGLKQGVKAALIKCLENYDD